MVDAEVGGDGADLPVLAVIEAANLGVLFGRDHRLLSRRTRRIRQGGGRSQALRRPQTMQPRRGEGAARARRRVDAVCPRRAAARGSLIRHAGARGTRAGDRDDRGGLRGSPGDGPSPPRRSRRRRRGPTGGRAVRVAAITRRADREERWQRPADSSGEAARPWSSRRRPLLPLDARARFVAQRKRLPWSHGARGGHRGPGVPAPGPHLITAASAYLGRPRSPTRHHLRRGDQPRFVSTGALRPLRGLRACQEGRPNPGRIHPNDVDRCSETRGST